MKAIVIGGGITGCLSAFELMERGFEVTVFEATAHLGGVLRDVTVGEEIFFNNCQYLDSRSFSNLDVSSHLYEFTHHYGSFTNLLRDERRLVFDCAQPCLTGRFPGFDESRLRIHASALERLFAYGVAGEMLATWATGFGDLERIDYRCLTPMQLARVYYPEDRETEDLKSSKRCYDELLAIPRGLKRPAVESESAWLPKNGFNALFDELEAQLRSRGCSIRFKCPVKVVKTQTDDLALSFKEESASYNLAVWASNPTPLFSNLNGLQLSTPPVKMTLVVGNLESIAESKWELPCYWQFFDLHSKLVRIYIYNLQGQLKFSAEFFGRPDHKELSKNISEALHILELFVDFKIRDVIRQSRFVNFSSEEYNTVHTSKELLFSNRIVSGAWLTYGRESKLSEIRGLLDEAVLFC